MDFVHLHNHTEYSLLDGAARVKDLIAAAKSMNMPALAITDHGVMYGVTDFYKGCLKEGIKPIIGCEVYVAPRTRFDREPRKDDSAYHLVLLAENMEGYHNLCKLVSYAYLDGFYYKPRVDKELLRQYSKGIICLSACIAGEIPQAILANQIEEAYRLTKEYRDIFGADNFFLEIQDHGMEEEKKSNRAIIQIAKELDIPLVCTNDIHYVRKQDAKAHDILLCVQTGRKRADEDRMSFASDEFYLKSEEEMALLFGEYPEAMSNTLKIAERCNLEFTFGKLYLPIFQVPEGYTIPSYLRKLCEDGMHRRYPEITPELRERLEYELGIIEKMDFPGYFLIVWDMINFARTKGIPVGPGRGSGAGSIVAYALGITDIDPIRYHLIFERFLNPERVSPPDIDTDFCFNRRGEVIEYLVERYGSSRVCQIITFGTMQAKAAVKDVARVLDMPFDEANQLAKLIPAELGITLQKALEKSQELRELKDSNPLVNEVIEIAMQLEGIPRHASTHAAGVVIAQKDVMEYVPVQKTADGFVTSQFAKEQVEEWGLLKMDLLGLRNLTIIADAVENIKHNQGLEIDIRNIPMDDKKTYEMLAKGDSGGVFQLESDGMRNILRNLKAERIEDIIALVALYRPGPLGSGMVEDFINRKHGTTKVTYPHPLLEPILKETYGVILYQEQVMQIASAMAGFTLGEADLLRRAMGKKKPQVLLGMKAKFLEGAKAKGISEKVASDVFALMEYFAGYGFNKSHSAAYAVVTYQTAWLKANYPVEYMAAMLTNNMGDMDRVAELIEECRHCGIQILPPDINESRDGFTVAGCNIRFGLAAVKNVGKEAIGAIIQEREENGPYTTLVDFCGRQLVNRKMLESLISCGAMDCMGYKRSQMLAVMEKALEIGRRINQDRDDMQMSLFDFGLDMGQDHAAELEIPDMEEFPDQQLLALEKDMIGFYISGHPLKEYEEILRKKKVEPIADIIAQKDHDSEVKMGGLITYVRPLLTKKGDNMAMFTIEDMTHSIKCLMFPRAFEKYRALLAEGQVVIAGGRVNAKEDEKKIFVDSLQAPRKLYVRMEKGKGEAELNRLQDQLRQFHGNIPVSVFFEDEGAYRELPSIYWVNGVDKLMHGLRGAWGEENIIFR